MSWTDGKLNRVAVALACMAGCSGTALAQAVVVKSDGPSARSYPAGKSLTAAARITLTKGDTLVLLDNRGMRTLRGPGSFGTQATATAASQSFASLVETQNKRRPRTGATRGTEFTGPPSLWFVDSRQGATMCVIDPAAVQIWREDMERVQTITIADKATGRKTDVAIPIGRNALTWPVAAMPIAEGKRYTLTEADKAPIHIRFTMMAGEAAGPLATHEALDAKGCTLQAKLLIDTLDAAAKAAAKTS